MNARHLIPALAAALPLALASAAGAAPSQQLLGQFTDWAAYSATTSNGKVCFVISQPKKREPTGLNRDPAYVFVSNRPGDKVHNEVSMQVGFPMKSGAPVQLSVGSDSFDLVSQGERAWTNGQDDAKIVAAMRAGANMTIKSTSTRDHLTTDTYSLSGVSAALDRINKECP
jgi:invasion protein IalB